MTVYTCMKFRCTKNGVSKLLETAVLIGNLFVFIDVTKWRALTVQGNGKYSTNPYYFLHNKMFAFNILRDANIPLQFTWTQK